MGSTVAGGALGGGAVRAVIERPAAGVWPRMLRLRPGPPEDLVDDVPLESLAYR